MEVNNNRQISFNARRIAKIYTPSNEINLFSLDKVQDKVFLNNLRDTFTSENIKSRFPNTFKNVTLGFIEKAFESVNKSHTKAVVSIVDNVPTGFISYNMANPSSKIHLGYLACWKPENMQKIKNNGVNLIRQLFEDARINNTKEIDVVPAYFSDSFYEKMGFEPDLYEASVTKSGILSKIEEFDKKFKFEKIENSGIIDLKI